MELPKAPLDGQRQEISVAINIAEHPVIDATPQPREERDPCDKIRQVTNEKKLNHASNFGNSLGSDPGDSIRIMMSEQLVTVNATRMPAETKSSR